MKQKRFIKYFLYTLFFFLATAGITKAYYGGATVGDWENNTYGSDNYNLESSVNENTDNLVISLSQKIFGPTNETYQEKVGPGALNIMGNMIAQLYDIPPASSVTYFADLGKSLGIVKPAYAQGSGVGFSGLLNILPLWKASRNIAYVFFVVVFIAIGLAIMFRIKISPQAVVTIQNALPKLIIALILVTFSYAIAGFLIDLIYLLIYIPILVVAQAGYWPLDQVSSTQQNFANMGPLDIAGHVFGVAISAGVNMLGGGGIAGLHVLGGGGIGALAGAIITGFSALGPVGWGALAGAVLLPILILGIIILVLVFKLFFKLLNAYISIIISIVAGPIQIMLGALPGNSGGFGKWINNLLANILIFPAVIILIFLSRVIVTQGGPSWTPPGLGVSGGAITAIISLGMLLLITKVPDMIKEAFKMRGPGFGAGIGEAFGPAKKLMGVGYKAGATKTVGVLESREHFTGAGILSSIAGVRGPSRKSPSGDNTSTGT